LLQSRYSNKNWKEGGNKMAKVVRIGEPQYKKLKGLADSHGVAMSTMLDVLMDKIKGVNLNYRPAQVDIDVIIDEGFEQMIEQYPTLAEVEKKEGNKDGSKTK
jgi:hypothetical protein